MSFDYEKAEDWFSSEDVQDRVRAIVHDRLADDRSQEECRCLMRFWWHMVMGYTEISYIDLKNGVRPEKFELLQELFDAIEKGPEYVFEWIEFCESNLPNIEQVLRSNPS